MGNTVIEDKNTANYQGFSLVSGGLIYKLTTVFRGKDANSKKGIRRTAIALSLITWLPVCILALVNGTLIDDDTTISFFEDFLFQFRFLFVVPFLIIIERIVDKSFIEYMKNSDLLVPDYQQDKFNKLVARIDKLTDSYVPEILILIAIFLYIFLDWNNLSAFDSGRNYLAYKGTDELNSAGWYYILVSIPILQLLIFRWVWRWMVWAYSIMSISRYDLKTDPLHADDMAGLSYINLSPLNFSFILFAASITVAAAIGIEIVYHGTALKSFYFPITLYLVFATLILYLPLLLFTPFLLKAKSFGVRKFGSLIRVHNRDYVDKWIDGTPPKNQPLLGSMDHSSLADINGSYAPVSDLKLVPIDTKILLMSFGMNALPFIPLIFTYYSVADLFKIVTASVFGG